MRAGEHVTPQVRLVRPLGAGGMGAVWVAEHLALKTEVAVKFILAGRENEGEARERFTREAEAAAQVKSPHVAQIFDHGLTEDGIPFIVMELLEGEDLSRYLHGRGRLSVREASNIVTQMCRALARAHARGLIHRDVKPANIFLCDVGTPERFVKLLDFGVAKMVGGDPSTATKSGSVTGTPVYMAPEQLLGVRDLDHRADLWSVGVVAYELLVGKRPLLEENAAAIGIRLHTRGMPRASEAIPDLAPDAAVALDAFFEKAWAVDPKERYDSALTLAEDFEALTRVLTESHGAPSQSFQLPVVSSLRSVDGENLTVRNRSPASNVTLQSGRNPVVVPPYADERPPSSRGPTPLHTETAVSRHIRESRESLPAIGEATTKRGPEPKVIVLSLAVFALAAVALFLGTRTTPERPSSTVVAPAAPTVAASGSASAFAAASSAPQPSAAPTPIASAAPSAPLDAGASPSAKPSVAPQPAGTAGKKPGAPSASATGKKLEDIE